jgi:hypothetical protein
MVIDFLTALILGVVFLPWRRQCGGGSGRLDGAVIVISVEHEHAAWLAATDMEVGRYGNITPQMTPSFGLQ